MMKPFWPFVAFLIIGTFLPVTLGLRCYECVSVEGFKSDYGLEYHKKCQEGDLPNSLGVDCSIYNLRNPETLKLLAPDEISVKDWDYNVTWMCSKRQGKFEGKDATVKLCEVHAWFDMPRDEVDRCGDEETQDDGPVKFCNCFSDLCNGSNPRLSFAMRIAIISFIATYFC